MQRIVMIDWAGPILTGEQMHTLRNILAIYLRKGTYDQKVNFTHLLVEGKLTFRGHATYGMFYGNRFFVDFGSHSGAPWYVECLLPARSEYIDIPEDAVMFAVRPLPEGPEIDLIDVDQCHATDASIL